MADDELVVYVRVNDHRTTDDPPVVRWTTAQEQELWRNVSGKSIDKVDWAMLAQTLSMPVGFVLQRASALFELELAKIKNIRG